VWQPGLGCLHLHLSLSCPLLKGGSGYLLVRKVATGYKFDVLGTHWRTKWILFIGDGKIAPRILVSSTIQASFHRLESLQHLSLFTVPEDIDYGTQSCTSSGLVCPWASHSSRTCAAPVSHYHDLCSQYLPLLPLD
jgi:hypothetical protein